MKIRCKEGSGTGKGGKLTLLVISHLLFANDCLIFIEVSPSTPGMILNLKSIPICLGPTDQL